MTTRCDNCDGPISYAGLLNDGSEEWISVDSAVRTDRCPDGERHEPGDHISMTDAWDQAQDQRELHRRRITA
jgi:hypothetical protein